MDLLQSGNGECTVRLFAESIILTLSQEWGNLIHVLNKSSINANVTPVRTNRGPPAEEILLGDMEDDMSPTFPK